MDIFQSYHLTLLERGRALALLGKYKNAMNWHDKVLAIDPSNSLAKTDKQKAQLQLKKKREREKSTFTHRKNKFTILKVIGFHK